MSQAVVDAQTNRVAVVSTTIDEVELADSPIDVQSFTQEETFSLILLELRKLNLYMASIVGETYHAQDVTED